MLSFLDDREVRVLVTGGTGFVGKSILRLLLHDLNHPNLSMVVLSRHPNRFLSSYPEFVGDSRLSLFRADTQERNSLPWSHTFTHVLHAAADVATLSSQSPLKCYNQIVDGTRNILDLAVATGARRFLLTSCGAIYGSQPPDLPSIPENWPASPPLDEPCTAYSQAKRAAEHLCALFGEHHSLETVVARCFAFVGPDLPLNVHFALGNFIRDALTSDAITVRGDGTPLRTFLDQRDLAHWLFTSLEQGESGQAYNVGSDEVISIASLAYLVRDILAPDKPVHVLGQPDLGAARNRYVPDISKARHDLGLEVTIPLAESIKHTGEVLRHRSNSDE